MCRISYGMLTVVANLDDYLADEAAYLAAHPVDIKDELLKNMRTRKEWKLEDLAVGVEELDHGRSFGNGKQIFTVASCVGCHKLGGVGNTFGPDLTQLDPKWKPIDVLKELLDPSARINEKFQTVLIETKAGKTYTGLILEETPKQIKLIENPLVKAAPIVIAVTDIDTRAKSMVSIMPKGLLDKLNFIWFVNALAIAAAVVYGRPLVSLARRQPGRLLFAALLVGLVVAGFGAFLILPELRRQTQPLGLSLSPGRLGAALRLTALTFDGRAVYGMVTGRPLPSPSRRREHATCGASRVAALPRGASFRRRS